MKIKNNKFLTIFITFCFVIVFLCSLFPLSVVKADKQSDFDKTNVLDDLTGSIINGKTFNLEDYPTDLGGFGRREILNFAEFCYSKDTIKQSDFGLYVYFYNSERTILDENSDQNTISFSVGLNNENYKNYKLKYLSHTTFNFEYNCVFYKFKVVLSPEEKTEILTSLINTTNRIYNINRFEFVSLYTDNIIDDNVALSFSYSGFAKGFGSDPNVSDLICNQSIRTTLKLTAYPTFYRPAGSNGKSDYTQDSLHSVYFSVPNSVLTTYGNMSKIHAEWLDAVLKPGLVTGNQDAFNQFNQHLGKPNSEYNKTVNYMYIGGDRQQTEFDKTIHKHGYLLNNVLTSTIGHNFALEDSLIGSELDALYFLFNSGAEENSADTCTIYSEELKEYMKNQTIALGGELVNNKYSKKLFESVASTKTNINIHADDVYGLKSETISQSWWEKLYGGSHVESTETFNGIKAIVPVSTSDFTGTDKEISDRLFISEGDCPLLKSFCNKNTNSTVFLFRYQKSDYIAQQAFLYEYKNNLGGERIVFKDSNAYFFQETVNLGFDIIDVTFTSPYNVETNIPAVMDPIDIFPDVTPPVIVTPDNTSNSFVPKLFKSLLSVLLIVLLIWLLSLVGLLKPIFKILIWIISLPIKFVKWIINLFKKDKQTKNNKKNKK